MGSGLAGLHMKDAPEGKLFAVCMGLGRSGELSCGQQGPQMRQHQSRK